MTRSQRRAGNGPDGSVSEQGQAAPAGRSPPADGQRTTRGERTRQALVEAGRAVFERDGFLDARITDIAAGAGVAHGSFYTYFRSKHEVFREVIRSVAADMATPAPETARPAGPGERIEEAIRHYLDAYRRNCRLLATLEQVSAGDEELRTMRSDARRAFVDRTARAIVRWQEKGLADSKLDPRYAASALGNMVDRFAYVWMVLGEPFEEDLAVETLTRIWLGALGLGSSRRRGPQAHRKVS